MGRDEFGHFYGIYGIPPWNDSCDISKGSFHYDFQQIPTLCARWDDILSMGFKGNILKQRKPHNPRAQWGKQIGVENQVTLINIFTLPFQICPFTSWHLSVPIFITKLAKYQLSHCDAGSLHCVNRRRLRRHVRTLGWGPWGPLDPRWNPQGKCRSVLFPVLQLLPAGDSTPGLFWLNNTPHTLATIATYHHGAFLDS